MEIESVAQIEKATEDSRSEMFRLGTSLLFIVAIMLYAGISIGNVPNSYLLVTAAMIGGYMAINIGANDVANNVGPAVGSKAMTLFGAIVIAAVFEAAGALIAGGDVVSTIKKGIIDPSLINDTDTFVWLMMAALLAGAIWLNIATAMGAPVSTTHSIVGGVLGAGIAAGGLEIANWPRMGQIAASWVISPVLGGVIAAAILYFIKQTITYKGDQMVDAAKRVVPILVGIMAWAFSTYLVLKGFKKIWAADFTTALTIGAVIGLVVFFVARPLVRNKSKSISQDKNGINQLFVLPLICAAALLSFAHGANDVANAVGPLAAINDAILNGGIVKKASIPFWVMMVGAVGIAVGLALYGPKLIRTVGSEITDLDQTRAFCIALAAAITVIIATTLGLPVSSTHVAVGGVFGVGFLREYIKVNYAVMLEEIKHHHESEDDIVVERMIEEFKLASTKEKGKMLQDLKTKSKRGGLSKKERRSMQKIYKHELVKRSHLIKIATAWIITVPLSGLLAGMLFFTIRGMMLP
ncbi:MAG: inorganic phosphate transporter [Gammaproteobacteria bacterium]|jgi:inorganic phosphate transporter, PiT family|nr:inorganic phosphate transporter [Gammaproteobacteria bacterium]MBT4491955.1 inorganic phosphate transporter [Gammaproteobacteria bacterium]